MKSLLYFYRAEAGFQFYPAFALSDFAVKSGFAEIAFNGYRQFRLDAAEARFNGYVPREIRRDTHFHFAV